MCWRASSSKRCAQSNAPSGLRPVDPAEVVDHVAAPDDQHPRVAERGEPATELDVVLERLGGVDRQLHDGHVGVGEQVGEHGPGAVIDAPTVDVEPHPDRLDDLGDLRGDVRCAGRRVLEGEQLVGEPEEVVDRARLRHRRHGGVADVPVGRHAEDRPRPRQPRPQLSPRLGVAVQLERVHRAAVPDEQRRHPLGLARRRVVAADASTVATSGSSCARAPPRMRSRAGAPTPSGSRRPARRRGRSHGTPRRPPPTPTARRR